MVFTLNLVACLRPVLLLPPLLALDGVALDDGGVDVFEAGALGCPCLTSDDPFFLDEDTDAGAEEDEEGMGSDVGLGMEACLHWHLY